MNLFLLATILLINVLIYKNFSHISDLFNFFDKPDKNLKKHSKPISLIGGTIILLNLIIIILLSKILDIPKIILEDDYLFPFVSLCLVFYLIGLIDDLKNLKPNNKLFLIIFFLTIITLIFPQIKIQEIKISFLSNIYFLNSFYSYIFIVMCFSLLINAINMFDGINLQVLIYTLLVFFVFILKGLMTIFFISLSICIIMLAILNYQNRVFLGDNGSYLVGCIIGFIFIYQYKTTEILFYGDEVFLILIIPALDMVRLFSTRLMNKKNPFKGDLNHLHHIVDDIVKNKNLTVVITTILCMISILLVIINLKSYYSFIIVTIQYFLTIYLFKFRFK